MTILIDSGSTKSTWAFISDKKLMHTANTQGLNPYYLTSESIVEIIKNELSSELKENQAIKTIYFYGAGCEELRQKEIISNAFASIFPQAKTIVGHDLLAATRALFGREKGIACIAGTGSNTCLYDGEKIIHNIYSPGLAIGDEGSGGFLGKLLIRDYVRKALPPHLREAFEDFTPHRTADILEHVYRKPYPNRYMASMAPFVIKNIEDPYLESLAYESFDQLFKQCIIRYENYQHLPIRFVGSIGFHLFQLLQKVAIANQCVVDKAIANPMEGLIEFHLQD